MNELIRLPSTDFARTPNIYVFDTKVTFNVYFDKETWDLNPDFIENSEVVAKFVYKESAIDFIHNNRHLFKNKFNVVLDMKNHNEIEDF